MLIVLEYKILTGSKNNAIRSFGTAIFTHDDGALLLKEYVVYNRTKSVVGSYTYLFSLNVPIFHNATSFYRLVINFLDDVLIISPYAFMLTLFSSLQGYVTWVQTFYS